MMRQFPEKIDGSWGGAIWRFNTHCKTEAGCGTICEILRVLRRISAIVVWPMVAGIAVCRLLMDIGRSCHTIFSIGNRQSAMKTWPLGCGRAALWILESFIRNQQKSRGGVCAAEVRHWQIRRLERVTERIKCARERPGGGPIPPCGIAQGASPGSRRPSGSREPQRGERIRFRRGNSACFCRPLRGLTGAGVWFPRARALG
jgi:hypothetical protein